MKLMQVLTDPPRFLRLTEDEIRSYRKNRSKLTERIKTEFPALPVGRVHLDDRFSKSLGHALDRPLTLPYHTKIDISRFSEDIDELDELAAQKVMESRAKRHTSLAKEEFLNEAKGIMGRTPSLVIESVSFDEMGEEDADYKLLVSAPRAEHAALLKHIQGMDEAEIGKVIKNAKTSKHNIDQSVIENLLAYAIERKHESLMESYDTNPEIFEYNEPHRMTCNEVRDLIRDGLRDSSQEALDTIVEFAASIGANKDNMISMTKTMLGSGTRK